MRRFLKNILVKEFLIEEYINNQKTGKQIAIIANCDKSNIYRHLRLNNIPIRSNSESHTREMHQFFNKKRPDHSKRMTGKNNPNFKGGKISVNCDYCSNKITRFKSLLNNENFCSQECKISYYIGLKATNYIHGLSYLPYPIVFNNQLKQNIRTRDCFECQNCYIDNKEHINLYNNSLHIHHINYNKLDCNEYNLITLCCKCNIKANFNRDYWFAYYSHIMDNYINC